MNKKLTALLFALCLAFSAFADVDIELPFGNTFLLSDIPTDGHEAYSTFFLNMEAGPLSVRYNFEMEDMPCTFCAGGSIFAWPFQTVCVSASAAFRLCEFSNKSFLELVNVLDAGLFMLFSDYYDVEQGKVIANPQFSPALGYTLELNYHFPNESPFFAGCAFRMGGADLYDSVMIVYALNLNVGYRIRTGM